MRGTPGSPMARRICSYVLTLVLVAGPATNAVPAFASGGGQASGFQSTVAESGVRPSAAPSESEPEVVRELPERRTESSNHYLMSDGGIRATLFSSPVRFRDKSGKWSGINTALVPGDELGTVEAASTKLTETFSTTPGSEPTARIASGEWAVEIGLDGAAELGGVVVGDETHYPAVAPDTSLVWQASAAGIKDRLVLASPDAPNSFTFDVELENLALQRNFTGGWAFYGRGGGDRPVATLGALRVTDSAETTAVCDSAVTEIASTPTGAKITYTVPTAWLQDPARVFPVVIDPSIDYLAAQDTYIHTPYNTARCDSDHSLYAGYASQGTPYYPQGDYFSLLAFDLNELQGAVIDSASLRLCQWDGVDGSVQSLGRNTEEWPSDIIYSDGRPAYTEIDSQVVDMDEWYLTFDVTDTVQDWSSGLGAHWAAGFQLYMPTTGDPDNFMRYGSGEANAPSERPTLIVDYSAPEPTNAKATVTPLTWDTDGTPVGDEGRGRINLSWPAVAGASGYRVMAHDGTTWRQVGTAMGADTTSWSSQAAGLYPSDTSIAQMASGSTSNAFAGAAALASASPPDSVTASGLSRTGTVLSDGTYLYVFRWAWTGGPTKWTRIGTGHNGTVKGQDYGTIGTDLSGRWSRSAFLHDNTLWNGFVNEPNKIEGFHKSTGTKRWKQFSKPLLHAYSGQELTTWYTGYVMLTSDANHIYSLSDDLGQGNENDGYRIRVFGLNGTWIADHDVPTRSKEILSATSDGKNLYIVEDVGTDGYSQVTKIRLSDYTVTNEWTIDGAGASIWESPVTWDQTNGCFWMGNIWNGNKIYRYSAAALDLRDDPRPLYSKTSGAATWGADPSYRFKVVPYNLDTSADIGQCATVTATLPKRSVSITDEPAHTEHAIGSFGGHEAQALLDIGAAHISISDLSVNTYGPTAEITRDYRSSSTAATYFAPGWRFGFEQRIDVSGSVAHFTDESGEQHRFAKQGSVWISPDGLYATLQVNGNGTSSLTFTKERTVLAFDSIGRLVSETDRNGNVTRYAWSGSTLTITAANNQSIVVTFAGSPAKIVSAVYSTADGSRRADYAYEGSDTWRVTTNVGTADENIYRYVYSGAGLLTSMRCPTLELPGGIDAEWDLAYASGKLARVDFTNLSPAFARAPGALVIRYADGAADRVEVAKAGCEVAGATATVEQAFYINPDGSMRAKSLPSIAGSEGLLSAYEYAPGGEELSEVNPDDTATYRAYGALGNVVVQTDQRGSTTTYAYEPVHGDEISSTDPAGAVTDYAYDAYGNLTSERRDLNETDRSWTLTSYDGNGLVTAERMLLSGTTWASTLNSNFATSGEPRTVTLKTQTGSGTGSFTDVPTSLGGGQSVSQIQFTKTSDAFGNTLTETSALGATTTNVYSQTTKLHQVQSTDASGVATWTTYDPIGNAIETKRTAGGLIGDWSKTVVSAEGRTLTSASIHSSGTPDAVVVRTCDTRGLETTVDNPTVPGSAITHYDAMGNMTKQWAEGADTASELTASRFVFDASGREIEAYAPASTTPDTKTYAGSGANKGLLTREDRVDGTYTEYDYDATGEIVSRQTADGVSLTARDKGGRTILSVTDSNGPRESSTAYTFDLADRQISAQAPDSPASTTTYNAMSWALVDTDADDVAIQRIFDVAGNVVAESVAGKTSSAAFDSTGKRLTTTDADGQTTRYAHDALGRVVRELMSAASGTTIKDTVNSYDSLGRVTSQVTDLGQETTVVYPAAQAQGPTTAEISYGGLTTTLTLDSRSLEQSRVTVGSGVSLSREVSARDAADRETAATIDAGGSILSVSAEYDDAGRLAYQWGSGLSATKPGSRSYSYDTNGRKSSETLDLAYGGAIDNAYTYTTDGRLGTASIGSADMSYTYDTAGNILSATGDLGSTTLSYGAGNRLASFTRDGATRVVGFDADHGWRTSEGPSGNPNQTTYTYTDAGRLATFDTQGVAGTDATYTYDANGQRTKSVVTDRVNTTTTTWTYSGLQLQTYAAERSDGATWTVTYLYDAASRPYAGVYQGSDAAQPITFAMVTTDRGDVVELLDVDGEAFASYRYDPWGNPIASGTVSRSTDLLTSSQAAAIATRQTLRYAGYAYDAESGLYYLSARYYDPATMQFMTKDPVKADGEKSAYQYCGGDPVGNVDPSGLKLKTFRHTMKGTLWVTGPATMPYTLDIYWKYDTDSKKLVVDGVVAWDDPSGVVDTTVLASAGLKRSKSGNWITPARGGSYATGKDHIKSWRTTYYEYWVHTYKLSITLILDKTEPGIKRHATASLERPNPLYTSRP